MAYQVRPEDYGMQYGERPLPRIKLVLAPEPVGGTPRRTSTPVQVSSEYDTRASARGGRNQQFTKSGMMAVDGGSGMEGVEMMEGGSGGGMHGGGSYGATGASGGYGNAASKKNTRVSSKDVRAQQGVVGRGMTGGAQGAQSAPGGMVAGGRGMVGGQNMGGMVGGNQGNPALNGTPYRGPPGQSGQQQMIAPAGPAPYMQGGSNTGGAGHMGGPSAQPNYPYGPGSNAAYSSTGNTGNMAGAPGGYPSTPGGQTGGHQSGAGSASPMTPYMPRTGLRGSMDGSSTPGVASHHQPQQHHQQGSGGPQGSGANAASHNMHHPSSSSSPMGGNPQGMMMGPPSGHPQAHHHGQPTHQTHMQHPGHPSPQGSPATPSHHPHHQSHHMMHNGAMNAPSAPGTPLSSGPTYGYGGATPGTPAFGMSDRSASSGGVGSHGPGSMIIPGTPSSMDVVDSLPGMDDTGSTLNSDDEDDGDKSKKNKRGKPKNRSGSNRKKDDANGNDDNIFGDEDPQTAGYHAAVAIWKTVEAYYADFTEDDFKLVSVDGKDDAFRVPNLGKKSASLLSSQSMQGGGHHGGGGAGSSAAQQAMLQHSTSEMMDMVPKIDNGLFGGPTGPNFLSKLIASMIEESSMPSATQFVSARPPFHELPLTAMEQDPMFGIFSQGENEFIEGKLKKELMALGLFGDPELSTPSPFSTSTPGAPGTTPGATDANGTAGGASSGAANSSSFKETRSSTAAAKEQAAAAAAAAAAADKDVDDDDEVLSELKKLQAQLRTRLEANNQIRVLLRQQMDAANGARKKAKEERDALNKMDQSYVQQHKAILKKKKKPTAKQAAAAAAKASKANNNTPKQETTAS